LFPHPEDRFINTRNIIKSTPNKIRKKFQKEKRKKNSESDNVQFSQEKMFISLKNLCSICNNVHSCSERSDNDKRKRVTPQEKVHWEAISNKQTNKQTNTNSLFPRINKIV
jgi:hypothetical protein